MDHLIATLVFGLVLRLVLKGLEYLPDLIVYVMTYRTRREAKLFAREYAEAQARLAWLRAHLRQTGNTDPKETS
jgi:hypothetical protein